MWSKDLFSSWSTKRCSIFGARRPSPKSDLNQSPAANTRHLSSVSPLHTSEMGNKTNGHRIKPQKMWTSIQAYVLHTHLAIQRYARQTYLAIQKKARQKKPAMQFQGVYQWHSDQEVHLFEPSSAHCVHWFDPLSAHSVHL